MGHAIVYKRKTASWNWKWTATKKCHMYCDRQRSITKLAFSLSLYVYSYLNSHTLGVSLFIGCNLCKLPFEPSKVIYEIYFRFISLTRSQNLYLLNIHTISLIDECVCVCGKRFRMLKKRTKIYTPKLIHHIFKQKCCWKCGLLFDV